MTDWRLLIVLSLPLLLGMRDPFWPPEDRCMTSQITLWHYRGMVSRGEQSTGIVLDASGKWRRLMQGQVLDNGWMVTAIRPEHMDITARADCEPSQWRWLKEGTKHDSKDTSRAAADGISRLGKRKTGDVGGG